MKKDVSACRFAPLLLPVRHTDPQCDVAARLGLLRHCEGFCPSAELLSVCFFLQRESEQERLDSAGQTGSQWIY